MDQEIHELLEEYDALVAKRQHAIRTFDDMFRHAVVDNNEDVDAKMFLKRMITVCREEIDFYNRSIDEVNEVADEEELAI